MKLTRSEIAAVKRVAATCEPIMKKKDKIRKKIEELTAEVEALNGEIQVWEQGIKNLTGYGVEELVEREVVNGSTRFKVREDLLDEQVDECVDGPILDKSQPDDDNDFAQAMRDLSETKEETNNEIF